MGIVDDHPVVRAGTAAIVEEADDLSLVGTAASLEEAAPLLDAAAVDVLLLDLRLGQEFGLTALSHPARPMPAIVVVTSYDYPQYVDAALRLGAAGYVLKTAPITELLDAIRRAAAGKLSFDVRPGGGGSPLSARERDVVAAVVDGLSNDEIAGRLGISPKTVESHLRRLFERHSVASRTELATRALRDGWLEVPPSD
ncbi:MAG TPA: response regulator transcription factor [Candidatus Limnocylindria bacterium]|nr:response regulator transcription factor [Candidatus Limnocylindria bacterium]